MPKNLAYQEDYLDEEVDDYYFEPEEEEYDPLAAFLADDTISEVIGVVKSGKEGTVYCCRPHPKFGIDLVAAKVFRPREHRSFRNQAVYREGFVILNQRDARALKKKTDWGKKVEDGTWMYHEFETIRILSKAGADVPKAIRLGERVLLMEYIGDESEAAPKLQEVRLQPHEARPLYDKLLANIELFLSLNLIHADLSPYNVLYWKGDIVVIDFPQAVDPRMNRNAKTLLLRDVENTCRYFTKYGIQSDPERITSRLWRQFQRDEFF